ncbi:aminoglycoside phosphotransferase family protein [Roseicyclus marinus]|uniref:aminoglycoside phosphotransferase family protein n=1 Tax=Roseicyclus marinus TaxID=2161673 RepID=UPI00240FC0B1|nr:phosphotransferase [Roseicyclus marinus]MDG3041231.1 phosphotransferase [Roseicyclus marinus]
MMAQREAGAEAFLRAAGWGDAARADLAGDASARAYLRLTRGDGAQAILMLAPVAEVAERDSLAAFLRVGAHLRALGLSAPEVTAVDAAAGLVLIEDLGDGTLARLLVEDRTAARDAYGVMAAEVLPHLARAALPDWVARPDAAAQAGMIDLTLGLLPDAGAVADLRPALAAALARLCPGPPVLALRDCHGDNLIWLPQRHGAERVGLLDHQDAVALPLGYDLASMIDDPRRDLPEGWREALIGDFAAAMDLPVAEVEARVAILSLLRNLRILGIFHRLATRLGKPSYRAFLPRTGALIDRAVAHPALSGLRAPVAGLRAQSAGWAA